MASDAYLLDNRERQAGSRFDALSALFDAVTRRHVAALGIAPGRRCWEIGAGGPRVPAWLAEQAAPGGSVLATDIDTSWFDDAAGVEVRRHDVAAEDPPEGGFDLIHARLVLVHVPGREEALRRMASALRPGGALLVEDFDIDLQPLICPHATGPEHERAERIRRGFLDLLVSRGVDRAYARRLPAALRAQGLVDVGADAFFPLADPAAAALDAANVRQVRPGLVGQGHATDAEVDAHLEALEAGRLDVCVPPLVSAWGRRPA
jgi:SAM-dependent methyltransferase